jgi:hypothetical protein
VFFFEKQAFSSPRMTSGGDCVEKWKEKEPSMAEVIV